MVSRNAQRCPHTAFEIEHAPRHVCPCGIHWTYNENIAAWVRAGFTSWAALPKENDQ